MKDFKPDQKLKKGMIVYRLDHLTSNQPSRILGEDAILIRRSCRRI